MKIKNMKLMLLGLLAMGSMNAFAQSAITFNDGTFEYESDPLTHKTVGTKNTGEVKVVGLLNPSADKATVEIKGTRDYTVAGKTWNFTVTAIDAEAFKDDLMGKVLIAKEIKKIGSKAFVGCTHLKEIEFAPGSELTEIGDEAFATTQIAKYDFTPCTKLTEFYSDANSSIFLEQDKKQNTFVTEIKLPTSTAFKKINLALAKLPNLTLPNISESKITEIQGKAFENDAKIEAMVLPNTVKTIAASAFEESSVKDLTIDLASIETIGDGSTAIYGVGKTIGGTPTKILEKLTMTGTLKGTIQKNAFLGETKLAGVLDMEGVVFGTTGNIASNAFDGCKELTTVKIGKISDNATSNFTIAKDVFANCTKLATVSIKDITTAKAIQGGAFGNKLTTVTIGNIYTGGAAAIDKGAFVFDNKDCALTIGNIRSTDATNPVMAEEAFDFSAVADDNLKVTIKIGNVEAKGKNFTASSIKASTGAKTTMAVEFGDIEKNGIDVAIFDGCSKITSLTFGAVGENGIGTGTFISLANKATVTFKGVLAENAIASKSFTVADAANELTVNYTVEPEDATYNPFAQDAFLGAAGTQPLSKDADRKITLNFASTTSALRDYIASLQISIDKPGTLDPKDDEIYGVKLLSTPDATTFVVYQKGDTNTSYGRVLLTETVYPNGLEIARRQDGVTYTLYTTYVEDDATNKIVTINMQPMKSTDGKYYIKAGSSGDYTDAKPLVVIIKATKTTLKETPVVYSDYSTGESSVQFTDNKITVAKAQITNEQLCDGSSSLGDVSKKDIYFLSNPANYNGISANTWDHRTNHDVYVAEGSFFVDAPHYDKASAARIVWLDGGEETTAISTVKNVAEDGVIYNMAGQQVDANFKGIVIKNGKKMIQK